MASRMDPTKVQMTHTAWSMPYLHSLCSLPIASEYLVNTTVGEEQEAVAILSQLPVLGTFWNRQKAEE